MPDGSGAARNLKPWEIAGYARAAGFSGKALETAVAVAFGESSGNANDVGDVILQNAKWGPSVGLWQIRSLKAERGKGTPRDETRLKDPAFNARAAYTISNGGKSFKPWTVYNTGAYLLFLPTAKKGIKDLSTIGDAAIAALGQTATGLGDAVGAGVGGLAGIPGAVGDGLREAASNPLMQAIGYVGAVGAWVSNRDNIFRIVKVLMGGGLVLAGVVLLAKPVVAPIVKTAADVAGKVK